MNPQKPESLIILTNQQKIKSISAAIFEKSAALVDISTNIGYNEINNCVRRKI